MPRGASNQLTHGSLDLVWNCAWTARALSVSPYRACPLEIASPNCWLAVAVAAINALRMRGVWAQRAEPDGDPCRLMRCG